MEKINAKTNHLIIVPGHAVYCRKLNHNPYDTENWEGLYTGETGYRFNDEVPNYVQNVQRGVILAAGDKNAVLVFSGGKTRENGKDKNEQALSEAQSYSEIAEDLDWFGKEGKKVKSRFELEEFARDSFENLLFSIELFAALHPKNNYPQKVTVVGLGFKEERYRFHAKTIIENSYHGISPFVLKYDAINDVPDYVLANGSAEGEELTLLQFQACPYGDSGILLEKKLKRDPHDWFKNRESTMNSLNKTESDRLDVSTSDNCCPRCGNSTDSHGYCTNGACDYDDFH